MDMKYCPRCKTEKDLLEFNNNKSRHDGKQIQCRDCSKEVQSKSYKNNSERYKNKVSKRKKEKKTKIQELKKNLCCLKCKEKRWYILDFHHIDSNNKNIEVSQSTDMRWEEIEEEISKCIVLCSNCHREFHYLEKTENITILKYLNP